MKTTVKGLTAYQRQLIVHIIALDNYTDAERAEHLKALDFCTDDVKRQVLSELERTIKQVCKMTKATKKTRAVPSRTTDGRKRWTHEETMKLIDMYNSGSFCDEIADAFKAQPNAIYTRINWLRKRPEYRELITEKKIQRKEEEGKSMNTDKKKAAPKAATLETANRKTFSINRILQNGRDVKVLIKKPGDIPRVIPADKVPQAFISKKLRSMTPKVKTRRMSPWKAQGSFFGDLSSSPT